MDLNNGTSLDLHLQKLRQIEVLLKRVSIVLMNFFPNPKVFSMHIMIIHSINSQAYSKSLQDHLTLFQQHQSLCCFNNTFTLSMDLCIASSNVVSTTPSHFSLFSLIINLQSVNPWVGSSIVVANGENPTNCEFSFTIFSIQHES